jgi:hypothetical protein
MTALYQLVAQYRELQQIDAEEIPEDVLRDTLEALSGELEMKATNVAMFCQNLDTFAANCDEAAKRMKERATKIKRKADQVRGYLQTMMEAAQITKIEAPEFTLAIRKNPPSLVIVPDAKIPDEFMVKPPVPAPYPDKTAIKEAIKAGRKVDGCRLEQGQRLEIRT